MIEWVYVTFVNGSCLSIKALQIPLEEINNWQKTKTKGTPINIYLDVAVFNKRKCHKSLTAQLPQNTSLIVTFRLCIFSIRM